ncbi:MAG: hypothetical protein ACE5FL_00375 [Myxococcota bacterium]
MRLDPLVKFSRSLAVLAICDPGSLGDVPRWLGSLVRRSRGAQPAVFAAPRPSYTYRAIRWVESVLTPDTTVFEYGTGGSTLFYARRAKLVGAVEHHPEWFEAVVEQLRHRGLDAAGVVLAAPQTPEGPEDRERYRSHKDPYQQQSFRDYVRSIRAHEDGSLGLVSVDGRARVACVRESIPKVRDGGYLVLDNSERDRYREAFELLSRYECLDFSGLGPFCTEPWSTTVWRVRH